VSGRLVVFTDLDGTLLRHEDYDWSSARPALDLLAGRRIPLVIASSKTRSEVEAWRTRLGIADPFITENGGALHVPPGATPVVPAGAVLRSGYWTVVFGLPLAVLRAALGDLSRELGVPLRGFGDMEASEVARRTGLSGEALEQARAREHDEPFVPARSLSDTEEARLASAANDRGLRVTRGGRFHHLLGANSKGTAARALLAAYAAQGEPVFSVGLGDGPNDLELLEAMDRSVVVARPDGTHAPELRAGLPRARLTRGVGPDGFTEAVMEELSRPDRPGQADRGPGPVP